MGKCSVKKILIKMRVVFITLAFLLILIDTNAYADVSGGFLGGDIKSEEFKELLVRWFQWGCFCPVMRLHGERPPFFKPEKPYPS